MSKRTPQVANRQFEEAVRTTAEAVWGLNPGRCQPHWYENDPVLHELDGLARLPDVTHLLMVTTSRRLEKVKADVKKLGLAAARERRSGLPVRKWLITDTHLEAEHIDWARKHDVYVLTHAQFQRRFFDGHDYLSKRRGAPFGSARNLRDGSISIPDNEYVALPMEVKQVSVLAKRDNPPGEPIDINGIADLIRQGSTVVLLGPYGAGKSLTTRELFLKLSPDHRRSDHSTPALTPLAINCREHWGSIYGDEILERHARSTGITPRNTLLVAWRAGMVHLLVDGFDELAAQTVSTLANRDFMRQARYDALQGVRDLVGTAPGVSGVLLCGRDHYFDNLPELAHALGINGREFYAIRLGEFTEEQAAEFLKRRTRDTLLPSWLPRKPLILGYLAHQDLLNDVLAIDASHGFGYAWDAFLTLVCRREAEHERAVMEPVAIRRVLEGLACLVRGVPSGMRPITGLDLAQVYRAQTGNIAGEAVLMQLQRLPGLTPREQDPAGRSFVDADMLAALQGGAVARAVIQNSSSLVDTEWLTGLTRDGVRMAAHLLRASGYKPMTVLATAATFSKQIGNKLVQQLVADLVEVVLGLSDEDEEIDFLGLEVTEACFVDLDLEDRVVKRLVIRECSIEELRVGPTLKQSTVKFDGCLIGRVVGVPSKDGLPDASFRECLFDLFDDTSTNAAVLRLPIPDTLKVLMTVLRKLYLQAGGGRKLHALRRGLSSGKMQPLVNRIVDILQAEGFVVVSHEVVHPVRRYTTRVHRILDAGGLADDPLVTRVREL